MAAEWPPVGTVERERKSKKYVVQQRTMFDPIADLVVDRMAEWRAKAACTGMDPDVFFPDRGESSAIAKAICAECPVEAECLEYALNTLQKFGVWGGHTERQRKTIRQRRRRERNGLK